MKNRKLYVGNHSHSVTNDELEELFANYDDVEKVNIVEGKGFGFIDNVYTLRSLTGKTRIECFRARKTHFAI